MYKVCVTGAAGRVAQTFIPLLCNGSIFPDKKIILSLLDINNEPQIRELNGLKLELIDCNYPNLISVSSHTDPNEAFKDCDIIDDKIKNDELNNLKKQRENALEKYQDINNRNGRKKK